MEDDIFEIVGIDEETNIPYTKARANEPLTQEQLSFANKFNKMYKITDKIVSKILDNGGTLEQDSYVVREEFGEALAAGYRYLRFQGETSAQLRKAGHDNEEVNYAVDMFKEIADVFMMTTSLCRHHEWKFEDRDFSIEVPEEQADEINNYSLEEYLSKVSEVLFNINQNNIDEEYIYNFLRETYCVLINAPGILEYKIDKLYSKIFKVIAY